MTRELEPDFRNNIDQNSHKTRKPSHVNVNVIEVRLRLCETVTPRDGKSVNFEGRSAYAMRFLFVLAFARFGDVDRYELDP